MECLKLKLTGISPLVMHNNQMSDPLNPFKKQCLAITDKRKRTDADVEELGRIEFLAGLYIDADGPVIPGKCLRACLIDGAKRDKMGAMFKSSIYVDGNARLEYDGPRTPKEMWENGSFTWRTPVGNQAKTVIRTRPRFDEWEATFDVVYDFDVIGESHILSALKHSSKIGLCDARALGYGKFRWEILA